MVRTVSEHFKRLRRQYPTMTADQAHRWAKHEHRIDVLLRDSEIDYTWDNRTREFMVMTVPVGDELHSPTVEIRVYSDDEPYDWGDIEPTDEERERLEVIGVGWGMPGEDDVDAIWGYGYTDGDGERHAMSCAIEYGYIEAGAVEHAERERLAGFVETVT